jgi:hypothetical protein
MTLFNLGFLIYDLIITKSIFLLEGSSIPFMIMDDLFRKDFSLVDFFGMSLRLMVAGLREML